MTTVADAIRSKTGGSDPLSFPTGFSDAIAGISGGGIEISEQDGRFLKYFKNEGSDLSLTADDVLAIRGFTTNEAYLFTGRSVHSIKIPWSTVINRHILDRMGDYSQPVHLEHEMGTFTVLGSNDSSRPALNNSYVSMTIPEGITKIEYFSSATKFDNDLTIPEGVTTIGIGFQSTFNAGGSVAKSMTFTLPTTLTNINTSAFSGTSTYPVNLICLSETPPNMTSSYSLSYVGTITVPKGSLEAYQSATNWSKWADNMVEATE